jgi:glycosyltransferase involved in cell wall biosynthesis
VIPDNRRAIGLFDNRGTALTYPLLSSLMECLREDGFSIHLFTSASVVDYCRNSGFNHIQAYHFESLDTPYGWYRPLGHIGYPSLLGLRMHRRQSYAALIGCDEDGSFRMLKYGRWLKCPKIYYSTHIREKTPEKEWRYFGTDGPSVAQACDYVFSQDEDRGQLLREHYGISPDRLRLLPNAPLGEARRRKGSYFYDRCGIPRDRKIALHFGAFLEGQCLEELVSSLSTWPEPWVFVLHSPLNRRDMASRFAVKILMRLCPRDRLYVSTGVLGGGDLREAMDSADAAFACYTRVEEWPDTHLNNVKIGHASGKMAMALRSGLPVIANPYTDIPDIIRRYQCGVVWSESMTVRDAILALDAQYDTFSQGALTAFKAEFDFAKAYRDIRDIFIR